MDNTLSGSVDVLAVLDCSITNLLHEYCMPPADPQAVAVMYEKARAAVAELIDKADTAATVLSNLIAAGQVDAGYSGHVTDLTAALARVGSAK